MVNEANMKRRKKEGKKGRGIDMEKNRIRVLLRFFEALNEILILWRIKFKCVYLDTQAYLTCYFPNGIEPWTNRAKGCNATLLSP